MILGFLLLISFAATGSACIIAARLAHDKVTALALGLTSGLVGGSTLLYLYSWLTPPSPAALWPLVLLTLGLASWLAYRAAPQWRQLSWNRRYLALALVSLILSSLIAPRLIETTASGTLATRLIHSWGDLGWHAANVTMFAEGQQGIVPENPIVAGQPLSYPFLINLLSGTLLASGFSLVASLVVPLWLLLPVIITLLFILTHRLTQRYSAAVVAVLLFVASGSTLGWLQLAADWTTTTHDPITLLLNLPSDYTGSSTNPNGYHFVNIITAALLPQRSFLFGLPLALSIVYLLTRGLTERKRSFFITAGILTGLTPLAHAHTCLALLPILMLLAGYHLWQQRSQIRTPLQLWSSYAAAALVLGLPAIAYYAFVGTNDTGSFFRTSFGWTSEETNLIWFWLKNTGLLPLAAAATLIMMRRTPVLVRLCAAAGILLLLAANTFAVAPWIWDNYKLLVYWLLFTLPAIGWLVAQALTSRFVSLAAAALALVILHLPAGALDLWKLTLPTAPVWDEWNTDSQNLAADIHRESQPHEVIITAPYHNNPAALSGRPVYLGFPGHAWSHGYDYLAREHALANFYQNSDAVLPEATPALVIVSPAEMQMYPNLIIRPSWQLVSQRGPYQLYRVTAAAPAAAPTPTQPAVTPPAESSAATP